MTNIDPQLNNLSTTSGLDKLANDSLSRVFRNDLDTFAGYLADEGFDVRPYEDARLIHFNALPESDRAHVAGNFKRYVEVMTEVKKEDSRLFRNLNSVWRMLRKMNMLPCSDLFNVLDENHIVQIYDIDSRQLYCSFNFFPLCSYTVEEIQCLPWFELFGRSETSDQQHHTLLGNFLTGKISSTIPLEFGEHTVHEKRGRKLRHNVICPRNFSPLRDRQGKSVGYIYTCQSLMVWDE